MVKDISITEALKSKDVCFVDVRSEGEFKEGSIPGAINIPIFNNTERAKIGTIYKQVGPNEAKSLGLKIASPKLPDLYDSIHKLTAEKEVMLYCWRGGMRSKYTASILESLGLNVSRIKGGYKAYRRYVHNYLDLNNIPHKCVVLHGLTGVGKTIIIQKLKEQGLPVLDLETIACHRGSAYGNINMPESPSQKDFESQIVQDLVKAEEKGVIIVECESRRVGKLILPSSIMNSMSMGYRILLYASMDVRVARIISDYTSGQNNNIQELQYSTSLLKKSLGNNVVDELNKKIAEKKFTQVIPYLLTNYYDPLYKYPEVPSSDYHLSVCTDEIEFATTQIAEWVKSLPEYGVPLENGGECHANRGKFEECTDEEGIFF